MSEHDPQSHDEEAANEDSKVDAIAAVILILIAVTTVVYWVSGQ